MSTEMQVEGPKAQLGPWMFEAHVETRVPSAEVKTSELFKGDVWFRIVLTIDYLDDDGENGVAGELASPWLYSLEAAAKQAKLLKGMFFAWVAYDDEADEYLPHEGTAKFFEIIDAAVARFAITLPGVD